MSVEPSARASPDIEGLCRAHCARVMECVWTPDIGATFDTEEGCRHNCAADVLWDECPREIEAQRICTTQYDCPEFADPRFEGYAVSVKQDPKAELVAKWGEPTQGPLSGDDAMSNTIQNDCWSAPEVRACLVQNGDRRDRWSIEFTMPKDAAGSATP